MKSKEPNNKGVSPIEDRCLKLASQGFKEGVLSRMGIEKSLKTSLATESIDLHIVQTFSDLTFLDEEDEIVHVEFESSNPGKAGLKRNRIREAILSQQYDKPVTTYVIFTGNVRKPMSEISEGINTYRILPVSMTEHNADEVFLEFKKKLESGAEVTQNDITGLLVTPFMTGEMTTYERISQALQISRDYLDVFSARYHAETFQAILYAYADKFLEGPELEKIKEELNMTKLGQMIRDEGKLEGRLEGKLEGSNERAAIVTRNLLLRNFSHDEIAELTGTDINFVREIAEETDIIQHS